MRLDILHNYYKHLARLTARNLRRLGLRKPLPAPPRPVRKKRGSPSPNALRAPQKRSALALEKQLFGGFSAQAIVLLEELQRNPAAPASERACACWALARWNAIHDKPEQALHDIALLRRAAPEDGKLLQPYLLESDLLARTGRAEDAVLALRDAIELQGEGTSLWLAMANAAAGTASSPAADAQRLEWLNKAFDSAGLARLEVRDPLLPLSYFNLAVPSARAGDVSQEAKLSVLVPAYNCVRTLAYSLDSILNQTWQNLEVIIVDDASEDDTYKIIEETSRRDSRVVPVRHARNSGAYGARNTALERATGEFVTVHDTDDWSHPQKFEAQIISLLSKKAPANWSFAARVAEDMYVDMRAYWCNPIVENLSSIMLRREDLLELGYWQEVRFSADGELRSRMQAKVGRGPEDVRPTLPLTFLLTSRQSLSGESSTGLSSLRYGARHQYRTFYRRWHKREVLSESPKWRLERGELPFPVPEVQLRRGSQLKAGLLLVSDFACVENKPLNEAALRQIGQMPGCAVLHFPRRESALVEIDPEQIDLIHHHRIRPVVPGDSVECEVLVVADPLAIADMPDHLPEIRAQRAALFAPVPIDDAVQSEILGLLRRRFSILHDGVVAVEDLSRIDGDARTIGERGSYEEKPSGEAPAVVGR